MPVRAIRSRARRRARARRGRGAAPSCGPRRSPAEPPSRRRTPSRRCEPRGRPGSTAARAPDRPGATCAASQRAAAGAAANRASPWSTPPCQERMSCASASATTPSTSAPMPRTIRQTLTLSSSAEARPGAESRRGRERRAPPARRGAGSTLPEEPLACSDGSAACSNDPFEVTNRRMNATSSGAALRPTTCNGIPARR